MRSRSGQMVTTTGELEIYALREGKLTALWFQGRDYDLHFKPRDTLFLIKLVIERVLLNSEYWVRHARGYCSSSWLSSELRWTIFFIEASQDSLVEECPVDGGVPTVTHHRCRLEARVISRIGRVDSLCQPYHEPSYLGAFLDRLEWS